MYWTVEGDQKHTVIGLHMKAIIKQKQAIYRFKMSQTGEKKRQQLTAEIEKNFYELRELSFELDDEIRARAKRRL